MENKEIIENNRLIAEFMGSQYVNKPYKAEKDDEHLTDFWHWTKPDAGFPVNMCVKPPVEMSTAFIIENWFYHLSWEWLMPVVEKIEGLGYDFTIRKHKTELDKEWEYNPFPMYKSENQGRLTNTYKVVIDFIKWYNQQK